jgi:FkbM family methyltransferase
MPSTGFLYRRLARFLPCVFPHVGGGSLSLQNKYDIASVRDVFMSAHYWRVFEHMPSPPKLIVDLGAHCGHFSVLCHLAILERFGSDPAEYILVEALPSLLPQIHRVVGEAGFSRQVRIVQGMVGKREGVASFRSDSRNLLSSQALPQTSNSEMPALPYRDLDSIIRPGTKIDILKIDIEGSEYDLIENYRHILLSANLLLIEVHGPVENQLGFERNLAGAGFFPLSPAIVKEKERLLCYGVHPAKPLNGAS